MQLHMLEHQIRLQSEGFIEGGYRCMAPSALDASILNSTSKLLSLLDLREEQEKMQDMEDMDLDQVMDVPDTPDRLTIGKINGGEDTGKKGSSSVVSDSEDSDLVNKGVSNQLRDSGKLIIENGNNKRFYSHHRKNLHIHDETEYGSSPIFPSLENPLVSRNAHLRRLAQQIPKLKSEPAQPQHAEHVRSNSHRHVGDRAKPDGHHSGTAEVLVSNVKIQDGSGGKMIDLTLSPKSSSYSINGRYTRKNMHPADTNFDKGKGMCTEAPSRHFSCIDEDSILNLTVENELTSKDFLDEEMRKGSIAVGDCSSLHNIANSSMSSSNACEGKTRVDDDTYNGSSVGLDYTKGCDFSIDSQPETMFRSLQSFTSPRRTGQKRLVRNGCISPYNIARAKQTTENHGKSSAYGKQVDIGGEGSSGGSPSCQINIVSPDSEGNRTDRVVGKGVMSNHSPAKEHDAKVMHLLSRSSLNPIGEANENGIRDDSSNAFGGFEEFYGRRSSSNRSKKTSFPLFDDVGCLSRMDQRHVNRMENRDHVRAINNSPETDFVEVREPASLQHGPSPLLANASSNVLSESDRENGRHHGTKKLMKRQKRHGFTRSSIRECSTSTFDDSEIAYLWSSGEHSNARSTRNRNPHLHGTSGPVIEIDEFSPEIRGSNPEGTSQMEDDDLDARARQVEADEILARQLQEQFYHELPGAGAGEIDASIAWTLQQQEDARRASYRGNHHASHPRDSSMSHLYRQYPSRSFQNLPVRSANRARVPTSARMGRLRSSFLTQSPTLSSGGRSVQFPPNMDLETRIHILEAMEAAVGNGNDMGMADLFFQVQRDFNENDYEMLLALDEDNHQHGASMNQINGLPLSTVQTDNFEEVCAICLETPTTGDTIRHLPCLHKFHKDCIDPWLRSRTSCPVCKSCIT